MRHGLAPAAGAAGAAVDFFRLPRRTHDFGMCGWGEFTQAVTHHIFGDIDRHMTASVMDRNGMPQPSAENHARTAPGANHFLLTFLISSPRMRLSSLGWIIM